MPTLREERRAGLGWVLLVVALAVPGFLFYNWWTVQKAEHDRSLKKKAKSPTSQGAVFQSPPSNESKLINPIAATKQDDLHHPVSSTLVPHAIHDGSEPLPVSTASVGAANVKAMNKSDMSTTMMSTATITLLKDPMISPSEVAKMKEIELEKARMERLRLEKLNRKPPAPKPIERYIELQGIVAHDDVSLAIINGSSMHTGEAFSVGPNYPGKVKILSISSTQVVFEYKGRRFKKVLR